MGVFIFTYAALFSLRVMTKTPHQALHQVDQFQQVRSVQRGTTRSYFREGISLYKIRPH